MGRRVFDVVGAVVGLVLTAPLLAIAALGIRLAGRGPVLYRAPRVGLGGRRFAMYKLRTMRLNGGGPGSRITGINDPRVFPWGELLRRTKIDELPQLVNVLKGDMSIIGPRPEDPDLVARHYTPADHETLAVRPGLASPGSLYHDTHGYRVLTGDDVEARYAERLLPLKLALDVVYVRRASLRYDLALSGRTVWTIVGRLLGRRDFPDPPELPAARQLMNGTGSARVQRASTPVLRLAVAGGMGTFSDSGGAACADSPVAPGAGR